MAQIPLMNSRRFSIALTLVGLLMIIGTAVYQVSSGEDIRGIKALLYFGGGCLIFFGVLNLKATLLMQCCQDTWDRFQPRR